MVLVGVCFEFIDDFYYVIPSSIQVNLSSMISCAMSYPCWSLFFLIPLNDSLMRSFAMKHASSRIRRMDSLSASFCSSSHDEYEQAAAMTKRSAPMSAKRPRSTWRFSSEGP